MQQGIVSWDRFKKYYLPIEELGFALDISRMDFPDSFLEEMRSRMDFAFKAMQALENGAMANPDEDRMVGHYWLRNSDLAPNPTIKESIDETLRHIKDFTKNVHEGKLSGQSGPFKNLLVIGIGGSTLGPQFVSQALAHPQKDKMMLHFFDNTDPDGIDLVLSHLEGKLGETLTIVISKSGRTPETRNGMIEAESAYKRAGLHFAPHAVAITSLQSELDRYALSSGWLSRFPMWDWVGGRTSETSPVGLLPASLQGIDIEELRRGAAAMDKVTRCPDLYKNPAALLALMWFHATGGRGTKDMVILPYKDRLILFSRYLQQLVMESLGKEKDLQGNTVNQGIAVYGNKGSTDQHAYVQQLREGLPNFFVTFIEVLKDRSGSSIEVASGATAGDYLKGFLLGTRSALYEKGRASITITIDRVSPASVGMLIALYERSVGFYASLIGINAYHQPGVEAGKRAAATFLELNQRIFQKLKNNTGKIYTAESLATELNLENETEIIFKLLEHMAANPDKGIRKDKVKNFPKTGYSYNP